MTTAGTTIDPKAYETKHLAFAGRMVMIGFGSIGQGVLPLFFRHVDMKPEQVTIITAEDAGHAEADAFGVTFIKNPLTIDNYKDVLRPMLGAGDFLVNLSVEVSSVALIELCRDLGALYVDTCIEPWPGAYTDTSLSPSLRSNYALRETALKLKGEGPTAVISHGANPGMVSHLVKQALINIAADTGFKTDIPKTREGWSALARDLGIKTIHIAERDTQVAQHQPKKPGEFVNTWSIDGFVSEGCQPAEMGWGTHEKGLPADGARHEFGCDAAIYLMRPGASTRVRTWTPKAGPIHGFLITHNEAISIADYFTIKNDKGEATYRPTCHYAYHPSDDAVLSVHEFAGLNWNLQPEKRLMMDEITSGVDELGVLLMGHAKGAYWFGSHLSIEQARAIVPYNNATSLQVTVAVLAGFVYALENPKLGVVEADEMDFQRCMEVMTPYLGDLVGEYSDWTPLLDRGRLFPEDIDTECPWQFKNFRVV